MLCSQQFMPTNQPTLLPLLSAFCHTKWFSQIVSYKEQSLWFFSSINLRLLPLRTKRNTSVTCLSSVFQLKAWPASSGLGLLSPLHLQCWRPEQSQDWQLQWGWTLADSPCVNATGPHNELWPAVEQIILVLVHLIGSMGLNGILNPDFFLNGQ